MDGDLLAWLFKAVLGTTIAGAGFWMRSLMARVRALEARPTPSDEAGRAARDEVQQLKLHVAEHHVRRDDYVPQTAAILQRLDSIGNTTSRIEEWMRIHESRRDD